MKGKPELLADLQAARWATVRRRTRRRRIAGGGLALVSGLAWLALAMAPPPAGDPARAAAPPVVDPAPPVADEPLLDQLADAGPIIITRPDGRREIHFTRATVEHP